MKIDENLKTAALAGAVGATFVLLAFAVLGALGWLPLANDARIHNYLMRHPEVVFDMANQAQANKAAAEAAERDKIVAKLGTAAFMNPTLAFVTGPKDAKHTFVEFFDYNCGYCRRSMPAVKAFYEKHKHDTRFAFIEMPINGPASTAAAQGAIAARKQGEKYLALHFLLMGEEDAISPELLAADASKAGLDLTRLNDDARQPEVERAILEAHKLAEETKINGTPAFIINGKFHDGLITEEELEKMVK